jgi:hypothetical protein
MVHGGQIQPKVGYVELYMDIVINLWDILVIHIGDMVGSITI